MPGVVGATNFNVTVVECPAGNGGTKTAVAPSGSPPACINLQLPGHPSAPVLAIFQLCSKLKKSIVILVQNFPIRLL